MRAPDSSRTAAADLQSDGVANIVLIGFMGCGKTTTGKLLAERLGWRFVDTDTVIERITGCDIPTLFQQEGEGAFRRRESQAVLGVCAGVGQVIATGGGAVLKEENAAALRGAGPVVWLTARPEVIVARTARRASRPLLDSPDEEPLARVLRLLGDRAPLYQRLADCVVDTSDRTARQVAGDVQRAMERRRSAAPGRVPRASR